MIMIPFFGTPWFANLGTIPQWFFYVNAAMGLFGLLGDIADQYCQIKLMEPKNRKSFFFEFPKVPLKIFSRIILLALIGFPSPMSHIYWTRYFTIENRSFIERLFGEKEDKPKQE